MRLPEFLTALSPVGETLAAVEAEQETLQSAVDSENRQCCVKTAEAEGLALWERDFGLSAAGSEETRRAAIRAALSGGQTATPAHLAALCITVGGADRGEVEEDFPGWAATLRAVTENRLPADVQPLRRAVERLCPAHLKLTVEARGEIAASALPAHLALTGALFAEIRG